MNIVCACDNNYAPYCGIMLTSLFENNKDSNITVYILENSINIENKDKFKKLSEEYQHTINFVNVSEKLTQKFPLWDHDHVSIATYYRLFITSILPDTIEKVLYLDCDIIINNSIEDFYATDIQQKSAAVVIDCDYYDDNRNKALGISKSNAYFCAGVMLINLNYWREYTLQHRFMEFISIHKDVLHTHDQDVLNGVLQGTVKYMPLKYNFQTIFLYSNRLCKYDESLKEEVLSCNEDDIPIIHYCTPVKPWNCWHFAYPFDSVWRKYKKISLWSDIKSNQSSKDILLSKIVLLLWKLDLKKIKL